MKCSKCSHLIHLHVAVNGCLAPLCRCELNQGAALTALEKKTGPISSDMPQHDTSTKESQP
jgi:hypothetical protein